MITWTPQLDAILSQVVDEESGSWAELGAIVTDRTGLVVTADMARKRYRRLEEASQLKSMLGDPLMGDALQRISAEPERTDIATAIRDGMVEAAELLVREPTEWTVTGPQTSDYAVLVAADWQIGKLIKGHYDLEIALRRVDDYFAQCAAEIQSKGSISEAHLLMLGDLLENETIFPKQPHMISASLFKQIFAVAEAIANGIQMLLAVAPVVYAEGVGGNHGYNQKTSHPETNFDCIAMNIARLMLQNEDRLIFPEPLTDGEEHWYMLHEVGQQAFFGIHGNQAKSQPYTKAMRDKLLMYHATMGGFDYAVTGHYHQAMMADLGSFIHFAAGSTESGNTYAKQWLAGGAQPGSQWLLFTDGNQLVDQRLITLS